MEAQLHRPTHGHHLHEEDPHDHAVVGGEGEGEHNHHGEKKSVLKKVKDKAKKIKDTITKHGHGHGHGHEHEHECRHDQISDEEEDNDDEEDKEMVNAPEVHGAPRPNESPVIPGTNLPIQTGVNLEKPTDTREDRCNPIVGSVGVTRPSGPGKTGTESSRPPPREPELNIPPYRSSPNVTGMKEANVVEPMARIGPPMGLEEDPQSPRSRPGESPPSNYQTKEVDPTGQGGGEADVEPLVRRLDKMKVHDETERKPVSEQRSYTGSHDRFAPQPTPTKDEFNLEPNPMSLSRNPDSPKQSDPAMPESMPRDTIADKISSATSAIADTAMSAKNVVASKLGYGCQVEESQGSSNKKPESGLATEYGHKVAETLAPLYEKVAGAGSSAMMSKVQGGGGGAAEHEGEGGDGDAVAKGTDKGVSMKEYLAEKLKPGEEDKALSEAISDVFHKKKEGVPRSGEEQMMTGKVMGPDEVVARFLGNVAASSESTSGAGVVDRVKGAVSSWFGKGTPTPHGSATPGGEVGHGEEEVCKQQQPRLQESGH